MSAAVYGLNDAHSKSTADAKRRDGSKKRLRSSKNWATLERSHRSELVRAVKTAKDELRRNTQQL